MPRSSGANLDSEAPSHHRQASLSSFPASRSSSQMSLSSRPSKSSHAHPPEADRSSTMSHKAKNASTGYISPHASLLAPPRPVPATAPAPRRRLRSQYPRGSAANHVEYILVASFDIDRGPVMDHQYPVAITGDENMLAELMLPDQAHARNQDWTIFFLHKDTSQEEEDEVRQEKERRRARRRARQEAAADEAGGREGSDEAQGKSEGEDVEHVDHYDLDDDDSTDSESDDIEGPPLVYVLNLVNTKHDKSVKRGAVVKAMAICTRHPFLHIYKPLLLLALEEYFKSPKPETLSMLYESVNAMDLSLMPKLSLLERNLLLASENKDLFVEKFERMIQVRMAEDRSELATAGTVDRSRSPQFRSISRTGTKAYHEGGHSAYSVARDTHEFESKVMYKGIPIPIKVPTAVMPETVGDFSLIKLIQNFSDPHAKSPQPFALHPHLTTNGANTHPIIVLVNALLTQKKVIFLGHNMPSGEVAEAVLAACALASGGMLRGFTRHAFPYTDLTKVDDLLNVPGFIAGVTNPTFEMHPEWWDILCDLPTGRIKISSSIEMPPTPQGLLYFQQRHPSLASIASGANNITQDLTGDGAFMSDILRSMATRRGERAIRAKWRDWIMKFTRIAAQFEESVYGSSALHPSGEGHDLPMGAISGHGFVWTDDTAKYRELASNAARIEGWRNTRSYYSFIEDISRSYNARPLKGLDLAHMHDRLRLQRLTPDQSRDIYLTLNQHIHSYDEICLLLDVAPESHAGLFYIALGLFHKDRDVRVKTADLLERIADHEAGQHWWKSLSRFQKLALKRIRKDATAAAAAAAAAATATGMGPMDAEGPGKAAPALP
ncbi:Protein mesA [Escovopsis weberi]|uniref:Protein mesA n=1 Tax=Escovopsis weberi TaxID=150374 RepID=A0A0M8MWX5_ESCWE|nr:Protein mesA [Escovopsis weberi]